MNSTRTCTTVNVNFTTPVTTAANMDEICASLQKINARLDKLDLLEKTLSEHILKQDEKVSKLNTKVDALNKLVQEKNDKITELEEKVADQGDVIGKILSDSQSADLRINELEQYSKRDNLVLEGLSYYVPLSYAQAAKNHVNVNADELLHNAGQNEEENLSTSERDVMAQNFVSFAKDCLEVDMKTSDILDIHAITTTKRKPQSGQKFTASLTIVRFNNRRIRDRVFAARTKLKNRPKGKEIYINEHLTRQNSEICKIARDAKKKEKIKDIWTINCKIYVRSIDGNVSVIRSLEQLQQLIN